MGLAASQARFLSLTGRLSLTQKKGQDVNNKRTSITNKINQYINTNKGNNCVINPFESRELDIISMIKGNTSGKNKSNKIFENKKASSTSKSSNGELDQGLIASLFVEDSKLQGLLAVYRTQENALKTEISAVNKVIDKNIEGSFKMFA